MDIWSIPTVVLHCKSLVERKQSMLAQLDHLQFKNVSFYEQFDAIELSEQDIHSMYQSAYQAPLLWMNHVKLWGVKSIVTHKKRLALSEISLTIKFGKVFRQLAARDEDYFFLFEDDVIFDEQFLLKCEEYLSETPEDWDVIYLGSGGGLAPSDVTPNQRVYRASHPASRCADSILIKRKAVTELAAVWFPFVLVSDWNLGALHYQLGHTVYWWEPSLTRQGSESGRFKSTLR